MCAAFFEFNATVLRGPTPELQCTRRSSPPPPALDQFPMSRVFPNMFQIQSVLLAAAVGSTVALPVHGDDPPVPDWVLQGTPAPDAMEFLQRSVVQRQGFASAGTSAKLEVGSDGEVQVQAGAGAGAEANEIFAPTKEEDQWTITPEFRRDLYDFFIGASGGTRLGTIFVCQSTSLPYRGPAILRVFQPGMGRIWGSKTDWKIAYFR